MGYAEDKAQALKLHCKERIAASLRRKAKKGAVRFLEQRAKELENEISRACMRALRNYNDGMKTTALMKKAGNSARVVEAYKQALKSGFDANLKFQRESLKRFAEFCARLKRAQ
ncbi:hypothetical protein HYV30_03105 [Candidatus Kaiserbacteria bacterium]|nr:hypothetical protein [Candidatus Kaiserbacteria bacterium]